jgi:hypothetical protein
MDMGVGRWLRVCVWGKNAQGLVAGTSLLAARITQIKYYATSGSQMETDASNDDLCVLLFFFHYGMVSIPPIYQIIYIIFLENDLHFYCYQALCYSARSRANQLYSCPNIYDADSENVCHCTGCGLVFIHVLVSFPCVFQFFRKNHEEGLSPEPAAVI